MMTKIIFICLAVSSGLIQMAHTRISIQQSEEIRAQFLEKHKSIHVKNIIASTQLKTSPPHRLDNPQILPEEAECLLEFIANSDPETQVVAEDFVQETINWLRLVQQREQELAECNAIGGENPSVIQIAQQNACRLHVESTTGVAVAISSARVSLLFWELRDTLGGVECIADV